ncbi:MAG: hypothetical protein M1828_005223 [Chrysothrix sp. TS-e1954]|nr:MAG: hypothetical protein M1828_005223 [Chrysothrix sp. TS-e1954]
MPAIVFSLTVLVTSVTALPGNPLKTFDDWIMCFQRVPLPRAGWPVSRDRTRYPSNQQLCPATSPVAENMACRCTAPGSLVLCDESAADPVLWNAPLDRSWASGSTDMEDWCKSMCWCGSSPLASRYQRLPAEAQGSANRDLISRFTSTLSEVDASRVTSDDDFDQPTPADLAEVATDLQWQNVTALLAAEAIANISSPAGTSPDKEFSWLALQEAKCNAPCVVGAACHGSDCNCHVTGARYEPSVSQVEYFAACQYKSLKFPGKRDELSPCPCNTTYVSHACCEKSLNGMVWEGPEFKLGELVKDEL